MQSNITKKFAKTKILATLGPATFEKDTIISLMNAGINGVRLNFSHGSFEFFSQVFGNIQKAIEETNSPLATLIDLQGPKIRIGELSEPNILIAKGELLEITISDILGNKNIISTSYKPLPKDASIGNIILIDDGLIRLKITEIKENSVICIVEEGGILKPKKGMNLPGMNLSTPSITEKDLANLDFALNYNVDYIALSFVRNANDILELKKWLNNKGKKIPIIAKIEKKEAVELFDEILAVSDGIMVARGDLGVEMEAHQVPVVQKEIIRKCNRVGKLVITATQMLESMVNNPIPTRAEASDVANAVWDGTDVVMLSAETSVGRYPLQTVVTMNNIIVSAESFPQNRKECDFAVPENISTKLFDSFCKGLCSIAEQTNVKAIVVYTHKGRTALALSKYKPTSRIVAISDKPDTMNRLALKWGTTSIYSMVPQNQEHAVEEAKKLMIKSGNVTLGDIMLVASAAPMTDEKRIIWMKFVEIK